MQGSIMIDISSTDIIHGNQHVDKPSTKNTGKLTTNEKEHIFDFLDTGDVLSCELSQWVGGNYQNDAEQFCSMLLTHRFFVITQELIEQEKEILFLSKEIGKLTTEGLDKEGSKSITNHQNHPPFGQAKTTTPFLTAQKPPLYASLFSLVTLTEQEKTQQKEKHIPEKSQKESKTKEDQSRNSSRIYPYSQVFSEKTNLFREKAHDRNKEEKEGSGGQKNSQDEEKKQKQHKSFKLKATYRTKRTHNSLSQEENSQESSQINRSLGGVENIYIRFMALMAKILGQAEAEAHDLYIRIKERTDNVDLLTLFISKINLEKGEIDWTENEEMKHLIEKVRAIGLDIPQDKFKWTEDEKRLLKENVQMRKDSMEKVTQLERTDMQRYLQEASQCHQARSNVLKLLKEVMDTIIHNMRP